MNNKFILALIILVLIIAISLPVISNAAIMPFGGAVTMTQPCNNGLLLTVQVPFRGPQQFMWNWGQLPYLMRVVPHPRQYLLGMALSVPVPCTLGTVVKGAGMPILYHGSSL
ncbi:MAG: hypothetical protein WCW03_01405 [Candidatus Paceibacterota bacterium]|jgi:hypothetical protein